jgi:hypothetical protein
MAMRMTKGSIKNVIFILTLAFAVYAATSSRSVSAAALIDLGIGLDYGNYTNVDAGKTVKANSTSGGVSQTSLGVATITPSEVTSEAGFDIYASSTVNADPYIESVSYTPDEVVVWYKDEGKLLALIPISLRVKVAAYPDGSVEVGYPWYSRITVDRQTELKSRIGVAVATAMKSDSVGVLSAAQTPAKFSPHEAALVSSKILEVLRSGASSYTLDNSTSALSKY